MASDIENYQAKLAQLNEMKSQAQYRLQTEVEKAKKLKEVLKSLGYDSLDKAKEDYARKNASLKEKEAELDLLIDSIKKVKFVEPTKEQVFAFVGEEGSNDVKEVSKSSINEESALKVPDMFDEEGPKEKEKEVENTLDINSISQLL